MSRKSSSINFELVPKLLGRQSARRNEQPQAFRTVASRKDCTPLEEAKGRYYLQVHALKGRSVERVMVSARRVRLVVLGGVDVLPWR